MDRSTDGGGWHSAKLVAQMAAASNDCSMDADGDGWDTAKCVAHMVADGKEWSAVANETTVHHETKLTETMEELR